MSTTLGALALALLLCSAPSRVPLVEALDNGLALRPPMGWLAWERFTCETNCVLHPDDCISEQLFRSMADRLVDGGYREAGYQYVNIDDCWSEMERDMDTEALVASRTRFPSGIAALAQHVHSKGLKLGLYGDCGLSTCAKYPAQLKDELTGANHFERDARSLAHWQVDSFKFDGCFVDPLRAERLCPPMSSALNASSRPILLICEWPLYMMYTHATPNYTLASESCNAWRYFDDIQDSWQTVLNTIDHTVKHQSTIVKYHGPGHWFDPDQLIIGNFGLSVEQWRAQMAIWSVWAAPLYMSNDLRRISSEAAAILKNKHLIEVNQDALGVLGLMVAQRGSVQAFVKPVLPVKNGCPSFAVVYLNRATLGNRQKASFSLRELLVGAPIWQAAQHQEAGHGAGPEAIDAAACLERLELAAGCSAARATQAKPDQSQADKRQNEPECLDFEVRDLFAPDADPIEARLGVHSALALAVAPSGVRAVKVVES